MKKFLVLSALLATSSLAYNSAQAQSLPSPQTSLTSSSKNDENETLLTDRIGKTLYVFDLDQGSVAPKCSGDCAELWPPYLVTAKEAAQLVAPLGTMARVNKHLQLTYLGRPVYTYFEDRVSGDDKGDGLGGVWHYIQLK